MFVVFVIRLFDWRPEKLRGERSKHERVVIVKNLFEPSLFDKDVSLILEYQQDLREECGKCGEVKRVVLYDVSTHICLKTILISISETMHYCIDMLNLNSKVNRPGLNLFYLSYGYSYCLIFSIMIF